MCGFCKKKYRKNNHVKIVSLFLSHYLFDVLSSNGNGHETDIPQWQIEENRKRVKAYYENPDIAVDFKTAMEAIKNKS